MSSLVRKEESAGFIVYRLVDGGLEYLLLQSSRGRKNWMPPKGHVEAGENLLQTATRETFEEAGLLGSDYEVDDSFCRVLRYTVKLVVPKSVTYWLARLVNNGAEIKLSHEHRSYSWLGLTQACKTAGFVDMCNVLNEAEQHLKAKHKL